MSDTSTEAVKALILAVEDCESPSCGVGCVPEHEWLDTLEALLTERDGYKSTLERVEQKLHTPMAFLGCSKKYVDGFCAAYREIEGALR